MVKLKDIELLKITAGISTAKSTLLGSTIVPSKKLPTTTILVGGAVPKRNFSLSDDAPSRGNPTQGIVILAFLDQHSTSET